MSRICLYYRPVPFTDRWVPGDRFVRPILRRIIRGRPRPGGVDKVFLNLCLGLDRLGIGYEVNLPWRKLAADDRVGVLGRERLSLQGYDRPNPIVAGIGLMTWPAQWPTLCEEYPVVTYLSHAKWVNDLYRPYFGDRCMLWPVGIDTDAWHPAPAEAKTVDLLIYDKSRRFPDVDTSGLLATVESALAARGLTHETLVYGSYEPAEFHAALGRAKAMIFLCQHESQGIACQEAMASGVPILAWDPGFSVDPERFIWAEPVIPATSVPFFDPRCGRRFRTAEEFGGALDEFLDELRRGVYDPRSYVVEELGLEHCAQRFVDYLDESRTPAAAMRLAEPFRASLTT